MDPFESQFLELCSNASASNVTINETSELWLLPDKTSGLVTAVFLLLILVIGLPWNLLVMVTILKEKLFKQPTIILLLNLTLTDLVLLLLITPVQFWTGLEGELPFGSTDLSRCRVCYAGATNTTFALMSVFTTLLLSFDRFLFIFKPLRYDKIMTCRGTLVALCLFWLVSIIISLLPIAGFGHMIFYPTILTCCLQFGFDGQYYTAMVALLFSLPIILIMVFNVWVIVIVHKNIRAIYSIKKSLGTTANGDTVNEELFKSMKKKQHQKQLHLVRTFGCILCFKMITWLPLIIILIVTQSGHEITRISSAVVVFFTSQVLLHPFAETALIRDVREPIKKMLLFSFLKQRLQRSEWRCGGCKCCDSPCDFLTIFNIAILAHKVQSEAVVNSSGDNSEV